MAVATRTIRHTPRVRARILTAAPLVLAVALGVAGGTLLSGVLLVHPGVPGPGGPGPGGPGPSTPVLPSPSVTSPPSTDPTPTPTPDPTPEPTRSPRPTPDATPPTPTLPPTAAPTPAPEPPSGPPECRYDDLLTMHHGLRSWRRSLLDTIYALPRSYAPYDLVDTSSAGLNRGYAIRAIVLDDLIAMVTDARAAGANLGVVSGYRSHAEQAATFQHWVEVAGYEAALRTSARAGHSEHQLGTTLDFTTAGGAAPWEYADWATTREGAWMAANAWRYGFVMSYPRGAFAQTCYDYEPWHYRYVGRELAARIRASGLPPRLILWGIQ